MRQDYELFCRLGAEIIAVGPDGPNAFRRYWAEEQIPFPGCADPKHVVADDYGQQVKWLKFGRMPAIFVIDREGLIRYGHYGDSMQDIPPNEEVLDVLREIQAVDA